MFTEDWIIKECIEWVQACMIVGTIAAGGYYGASCQPSLAKIQRFCKALVWICLVITLACAATILLLPGYHQPALAG